MAESFPRCREISVRPIDQSDHHNKGDNPTHQGHRKWQMKQIGRRITGFHGAQGMAAKCCEKLPPLKQAHDRREKGSPTISAQPRY